MSCRHTWATEAGVLPAYPVAVPGRPVSRGGRGGPAGRGGLSNEAQTAAQVFCVLRAGPLFSRGDD